MSLKSSSWGTAFAVVAPRRLPGSSTIRTPEGHFIADWVRMLSGARDKIRARHDELDRDALLEMEHEAVKVSLANLRTFPWIAEREQAGELKLHGAHFSIAEGRLYTLDEAEGEFRPV